MPSQRTYWLNELIAQCIEGASDAFLIAAGGSTVAHASGAAAAPLTPRELGISIIIGGALYAAAFLKKTPLPSCMRDQAAATAVPPPAVSDKL